MRSLLTPPVYATALPSNNVMWLLHLLQRYIASSKTDLTRELRAQGVSVPPGYCKVTSKILSSCHK